MIRKNQIHMMNCIPMPTGFSATSFFQQVFKYQQQTEGLILQGCIVKSFFLIVVLAAISFSLDTQAMAFEVETHRQLTDKAIESIESQLNTYLVDNLGLERGLNEQLGIFNARGWIIEGSKFEDTESIARPVNHFHDPVNDIGLNPWPLAESAIDWSLKSVGSQSPGGPWSWNDARDYYFKALTSPTKGERDKYWAKTFRALGQVMHLLQDQASPAHVRNDPHLSANGFGDVDGLHDFMARRDVATYTTLGIIRPDSAILEDDGATRAEPLSNLFDHNQYTGPNSDASLGGQAGLAEYANANFFSDDRIAGQPPLPPLSVNNIFWRPYPHPNIPELVPAPVPSPYLTLPRLGSAVFPGARAAKFTGNQAVAQFLLTNTNFDLLGQLQLDDAVYDAQATHLIPRAVGYSAAVLTYFFRGTFTRPYGLFAVMTFNGPRGSGDCSEVPAEPYGGLSVGIDLGKPPVNHEHVTYYYDRGDTRLPIPRNDPILHAGVSNPVRWIAVYQGVLGPGVKEPQGVFAQIAKTPWTFYCD